MVDVTDDSFEVDVLDRSTEVPVVVDLLAPWCGPCKTLGPILEKVIGATNGSVALAKVNIDENPVVPSKFMIRGIPTLLLFKNGDLKETVVGLAGKDDLAKLLDKHLQ